jgi:ATP-dependent Clp protease ATP-binding subunit ClpA
MIQDLIVSSRRMASLYRFRFIQPAHLLYAITGNETGRELVSKEGYDACMMRAGMIREFKEYSSNVRNTSSNVEPSDLFDKCCEAYLGDDINASYEEGLHSVFKMIQAYSQEDSIVSSVLQESNMKGTVAEPFDDELEVIPDIDFDDILREEMDDQPRPMEAFQPSEPQDPDEPGPARNARSMQSAFEETARAQSEKRTKPKPNDKTTKEMEEARAAVKAAQRDLTELAREGSLDPVVGRDAEISHVIEVLMRRRKPNVILVAEPGVGKSALVEGLAMRLASGEGVDEQLLSRPVSEVSLTGMVAGSRFRGDFESRMSILIAEAEKDRSILFIDEIHMIMGSGSVTRGGMDGANILKPALARDGLSVIGATTPEEALTLREDRALMRRFELIYISEPQRAQMEVILSGAAEGFLSKHDVRITPGIQARLLDFGDRYLKHRRNPDRTFDILDLAAVSARLRGVSKISEQDIRHAVRRLGGDLPFDRSARQSVGDRSLEEALLSSVRGQDKVAARVSDAIEVLENSTSFTGVIQVIGPAGVGKTHVAEVVSTHFAKRLTTIRHDGMRPDGVDMTWARIMMALEADSHAVIAIQHADVSCAAEINTRISAETQGGGRNASALRSPMIFCLTQDEKQEGSFGFRSGDDARDTVIKMEFPEGDQLEALMGLVADNLMQLQKDSGITGGSKAKLIKKLREASVKKVASYVNLHNSGMQYLKTVQL